MSDYVYQRTEFSPYELYTVGHYDPSGKWQSESDYQIEEEAAKRVNFLNGGQSDELGRLQQENKQLKELLRLAVGDMSIGWLCAVCSKRTKGKEWAMCQYQAFASVFDEERTVTCANFEWQHADKLKGLVEL